ncbi:hypothetical protein BKH41_09320 [Helicobacter sp. 12S02232-10]|uniref:hypothetical protein n=1 Tax=Helicobacter sp. 12S02232-10 TaxID=1476197 RepID=UPI000BA63273|nr:hypothetical protein [Helicobacter sp. 12S02232-10]PAF46297.1 hypothetical protein BKH41_09320 [Helicobacter sp. 12S02232-10]
MIVTTKELGELLGLSERHIYTLEKNEILSKIDKNQWDASKNLQAYIYYKLSNETTTTDGKVARTRKDIADAKLKEVMLAEKIGKLIPIEKVAKELKDPQIYTQKAIEIEEGERKQRERQKQNESPNDSLSDNSEL